MAGNLPHDLSKRKLAPYPLSHPLPVNINGQEIRTLKQNNILHLFLAEYQYHPATFTVTDEMKAVFDWDGAFIVRYYY